jgi:hypothetical protein
MEAPMSRTPSQRYASSKHFLLLIYVYDETNLVKGPTASKLSLVLVGALQVSRGKAEDAFFVVDNLCFAGNPSISGKTALTIVSVRVQ